MSSPTLASLFLTGMAWGLALFVAALLASAVSGINILRVAHAKLAPGRPWRRMTYFLAGPARDTPRVELFPLNAGMLGASGAGCVLCAGIASAAAFSGALHEPAAVTVLRVLFVINFAGLVLWLALFAHQIVAESFDSVHRWSADPAFALRCREIDLLSLVSKETRALNKSAAAPCEPAKPGSRRL